MHAQDYVIRTSEGTHVYRRDFKSGSGVQVYLPGDVLPDAVAAELYSEPETKPVAKKTTKPRKPRAKKEV